MKLMLIIDIKSVRSIGYSDVKSNVTLISGWLDIN